MAKCPKCGGNGGVMLFTSIAPCDACLNPMKYAVNFHKGDTLYTEVSKANYAPAPAPVAAPVPQNAQGVVARACAPNINPALWHGWKHPTDGWCVWTLDEPLTPYGFTQAMTATWSGQYPVLATGMPHHRWAPLRNKVQEWKDGRANWWAGYTRDKTYFGIALK